MARQEGSPRGDDGGGPIGIVAPTPENLSVAAEALRRGELVVMPTETVYGLAAVATNREAVEKVFCAKGRPRDNPLIVHVSRLEQARAIAMEMSDEAVRLTQAFWPGPLTLVLLKAPTIPDEVTAGLPSVALRVPSHPVARALLETVGEPLAAPSANSFMSLSPTRPEHVEAAIAECAAMILEGGACEVGLESTVVDCTGAAVILRPGGISREQIEGVLGRPVDQGSGKGKSPGQYPRHYAPRTRLTLRAQLSEEDAGLTFEEPMSANQVAMPNDPGRYAALLYAVLHEVDSWGLDEIVVQTPPQTTAWEAVWDRLRKAATP